MFPMVALKKTVIYNTIHLATSEMKKLKTKKND